MKYIIRKSTYVAGRFATSQPVLRSWTFGLSFTTKEEADLKAEELQEELGNTWTVTVEGV